MVTRTETGMLDAVIKWSIDNRLFVVIASIALSIWGAISAIRMPVDVFPDLTAPTVTIVTEAHGLAPEEVESLITFPIEASMNGATGVRRVRSASGVGISVIWVELDWGTDIYVARQIVNEKLQLVAGSLPPDVGPPSLAPMSSIMGEIFFLAISSDRHSPLEVREVADWVVRRRLLSIPGVAQVVPIGGGVKQFQVLVAPEKLLSFQVTLEEVMRALEESNASSSGGFLVRGGQESLIRALGRIQSVEDIERTVVTVRGGVPVLVHQLGEVKIGEAIKRGEGSSRGRPAVVLGVMKQPNANTLTLTGSIDQQLDQIEKSLPEGMKIDRRVFRQADFIERAVDNVQIALRDGAILVAFILFLFLFNLRTTLISLAAVPVSLLTAVLAMELMGMSINTMSLGGLTIAIGALVDDAIIDVENVFRRLRENALRPQTEQRTAFEIIYLASKEVRSSIVFATLIVMLVFVPLFFLSGIEGRLLIPLGFSYLVAIFASLAVALTLTPALCAYFLGGKSISQHGDSFVVRALKALYRPVLERAISHSSLVIALSLALLAGALPLFGFVGRSFLPELNEGSLTISAVTLPGTSLETSDRLARRIEEILLSHPEVASTARRTGRAELDEHAQDVNASEIDVRLEMRERSTEELLAALREDFTAVPGMVITIGQPISHRIDHMLSGTRANIAIKLFGEELPELRIQAEQIRKVMEKVDGIVDLSIEQQVDVPELEIAFDREKIARFGLRAGALAETIEAAYAGHKVTEILEGQRTYPLIVRYPDEVLRDVESVKNTIIDTPVGAKVPLKMLAEVRDDAGPNMITRENVQRKIVIMANVSGRDLGGVIADVRAAIEREVKLKAGYYVEYGGQFESERAASRTIMLLGAFVVAGIFLLLFLAFRSVKITILIMANLPFALIGGIVAVFFGSGILSIASLVGFITLFGIATRNGIMMISHYDHLMRVEGVSFDEALLRGSLERLSPILMTALCAGLALIPLVLAGEQPGNEIQAPMGVVILGGLLSSTALNMIVIPALFARFMRPKTN